MSRTRALYIVRRFKENKAIETLDLSPIDTWTATGIPPQWGRQAVVTGAANGLGYETALALAKAGSDVVIADCDESRGHWAVGRIRSLAPASLVRFELLDLASLRSVADFVERLSRGPHPIDLLINNAGVMALPRRQVTRDGIERQFAVNYLGHFALTAGLLPLLRRGDSPRVVQVSSIVQRLGEIHLDDLQLEYGYKPWKAYAQSKLAMLLFAQELQRRSEAGGWGLMSVAAHPGYARTGLFSSGPGTISLVGLLHHGFGKHFSPSAERGALPTLFAATSVMAEPGRLYGPKGKFELIGPPGEAWIGEKARDHRIGRALWEASEQLAQVKWPG